MGPPRGAAPALRIALISLALAVAACASGPEQARGVVVDVRGDLTTVESFTIRTADGEVLQLEPREDVRFHGGALSHLRQHLITGEEVLVSYVREGGRLVAIGVEDG